MDHKEVHLKDAKPVKLGSTGYPAFVHGGTLLHAYTPKKHRVPAEGLDENQLEDFYNERAPFELVVNQHFREGDQRGAKQFVSPIHTGKLRIGLPAKGERVGPKRYPKPSDFDKHFKNVPEELLHQPFITVPVEQLDDFQQPPFGTSAQRMSYKRRLQAENAIAQLKKNDGLTNQTCRVFNDGARTIAALARAVWHNLRLTHRRARESQEEKQARRAASKVQPKGYIPQRFLAPCAVNPENPDNDSPEIAEPRAPP